MRCIFKFCGNPKFPAYVHIPNRLLKLNLHFNFNIHLSWGRGDPVHLVPKPSTSSRAIAEQRDGQWSSDSADLHKSWLQHDSLWVQLIKMKKPLVCLLLVPMSSRFRYFQIIKYLLSFRASLGPVGRSSFPSPGALSCIHGSETKQWIRIVHQSPLPDWVQWGSQWAAGLSSRDPECQGQWYLHSWKWEAAKTKSIKWNSQQNIM